MTDWKKWFWINDKGAFKLLELKDKKGGFIGWLTEQATNDDLEGLINYIQVQTRADERAKVIAEVKRWINEQTPLSLVKRLCYKEDFVAELRAKLAEMKEGK